jgi:hypothetical protein
MEPSPIGIKLYIDQESSWHTAGEKPPEHCGQEFVYLTPEAIDAIAEAVAKKINKTTLPENYGQPPTPYDATNNPNQKQEKVYLESIVYVTVSDYIGNLREYPPTEISLNIDDARKHLEKKEVQDRMHERSERLEKVEIAQLDSASGKYGDRITVYERNKNANQ